MKRELLIAMLVLGWPVQTRVVFSQNGNSPAARPLRDSRTLITPETQTAIDGGLAWLAARQHENGSFGVGGNFGHNVAVVSLGGMAFLSSGSTPGRGKYGQNVEAAIDFVMSVCKPNGYINEQSSESHGPMYGHGFATLFLAEVYGMCRHRKGVRDELAKAVKLIVNTQTKSGGWRYYPEPKDADVSVTVCQIMALRAARNCGLFVPKETVDKCIDYVRRCQNPDGGFRYRAKTQAESRFPRSAAGVVALYSAGVYKGKALQLGVTYLRQHQQNGSVFRFHHGNHYFYGHYYGAQAMWQAGNTDWEGWYAKIRDELVDRQMPQGFWQDTTIRNEYGTAMACIILQMPNNYLPIFER